MRRNPAILLLALAAVALPGCGYLHHTHAHYYYPHEATSAWWWYGEPAYRPLNPPVQARSWSIPVLGDCTEPRCQVAPRPQ